MRVTGLPKSTVYRRIKKLVKMGYLLEKRERGKIWYEVANNQDSSSE
ncbi:helix-turn-helix domain-containing protein [Metallosphaera hakonensis]|nr:helix-turn-helix domain-containing protein [Metallosphaera hakonensis]